MMKAKSAWSIMIVMAILLLLSILPLSVSAEEPAKELGNTEMSSFPIDNFAVAQEITGANDDINSQEVVVSDTEEFIRWHSTAFGSAWYQWNSAQSVIQAADGSYVVAGYSSPGQNKQMTQHAYITKFNPNGSIAWDQAFGGGLNGDTTATKYANYYFLKVIQLNNGDFLAIGQTNDALNLAVNGYQNIYAVRLSNQGTVLWQKAYGLQNRETNINAWDAAENSDGSISIWGNYWSKYNDYDRGYPGMIELQLNGNGTLINEFYITDDFGPGATIDAVSCSMKRTADGGFIAYQNTFSTIWSDAIVKIDAQGTQQWGIKIYPLAGTSNSPVSHSKIIVLPDGYLIAGVTPIKTATTSTNSLVVYKLDLNGNLLWTKLLQNVTLNNNISDVQAYQTPADEVLLAVQNGYSTTDFTVVKMNPVMGDVEWVKSYGTKTGFDRNYGGSTYMTLLANNSDQIIGLGGTHITKFSGDGSLGFATDEFTVQNRSSYTVTDIPTTKIVEGALLKAALAENAMGTKDVTQLTLLHAQDLRVIVGESAVTGVTLSETEKTVGLNTSFNLIATVQPENAPNKGVSWSSDNEAVATVNASGQVTTHMAGTATITVTTAVGNKTATCLVYVTETSGYVDVYYQTHVQNVGWQDWMANGDMSGTSGLSLRLEGINIVVYSDNYDLGITYQTHVQNIGWQDWKSDGDMSGTSGLSLRLEGIRIALTGYDAEQFDVYYQVHAQNFGWLDWAKNGESSGTAGFGYRLEGIRIVVLPKGSAAPGSTDVPFVQY